MNRLKFTKTAVESLAPPPEGATTSNGKPIAQAVYWDTVTPGLGLRVSRGGARAFIYQGRLNGKVVKVSIGRYGDQVAIGKGETAAAHPLTVENARKKVAEIRGELVQGKDPRLTRPAKPSTEGAQDTLGYVLTSYTDLLEKQGKVSAGKVKGTLERHVKNAHPALWNKPAAAVTIDDCMLVVARLANDGKPREADKVRGYMQAAYSRAINARHEVSAPKELRALGLRENPAREIRKVEGADNPNERVLSLAEFRAYWKRINALPEPQRGVAMLHVLTGGQRMAQLARVTLADVDRDSMTMTLRDNKGRRAKPRVYQIPLLPEALPLIDGITGSGKYVFSADGGATPMSDQFVSDIAARTCTAMKEAGELQGAPFTGKHIRATIESRLMDDPYNVSSDVLARLLSHGLGGVQARHYARDPLLPRQLDALRKLWRLLNNKPEPGADVVQLRASA